MCKRIDKSWIVFASVENGEHDRCVDFFQRPDASFGFEAFRRDVEDRGGWTPTDFFSGRSFSTAEQAYDAAEAAIAWLHGVLRVSPQLRRRPETMSR
jgi:hypothetical protein